MPALGGARPGSRAISSTILELGQGPQREAELAPSNRPAGALALAFLIAVTTSSGVMPKARGPAGIDARPGFRLSARRPPRRWRRRPAAPAGGHGRRWRCGQWTARSPGPVRPSTAMGRSPGSLVSRVGRSARSGSGRGRCRAAPAPRAPSSPCRCPRRTGAWWSPRRSGSPSAGRPARASPRSPLRSARPRSARPRRPRRRGRAVRIVSTGRVTSGSSDTGSWPSDTAPSSTSARVAAMVVTGRFKAEAASDMNRET